MFKRLLCITIVAAFIAVTATAAMAEKANPTPYLKGDKVVKVYVKDIVNESGDNRVSAEAFKKVFEQSLLNRKSIKYEITKSPEDSEVQISGVIKKYQYAEKDPVKISPSAASIALDAVTTENYVEMTVDFTITDTAKNKVIWKEEVYDFVKHTMTPEESLPIIYDKVSRTFMWKSFGKGR